MKKYNHLTQEQRYKLEFLLAIGTRKTLISLELEVSKSTIYREIKRNSDLRNSKYKASLAQTKCDSRHINKKKYIKFTQQLQERVIELLKSDFSPEQICGFLNKEQEEYVSVERIYQFIWEDKKTGRITI